jgi:hypothetical protein
MRLAWDNKADAASVAADSELATLPASNVQQSHLSRKWHTGAAVKSARLIFDMGSAVSCSLLAVLGANLTETATLRLRASTLDPAVLANLLLDTGTIAAGAKTGYGAAFKAFGAVAARYWGLDLADLSVPDNLQVGRIFLGPHWQHSQALLYGWELSVLDASEVVESYGGQSYADERPQRRVIDFSLDFLSEQEMYENTFALARANGVVRDVLVIPMEGSAYVSEQAVFGLCQAHKPIVHRASQIFRQQFTVKERL